jgi:hypothetical protein
MAAAALRFPNTKRRVTRDIAEITVGCEHRQIVTNAKLRKERIDRSNLYAGSTAFVAQFGGVNVILPVGHEEWKCRKSTQYLGSRFRALESLKQFLQNKTRRQNTLTRLQRTDQSSNLRLIRRCITPKCQRPDARIDEKAQLRERSDL